MFDYIYVVCRFYLYIHIYREVGTGDYSLAWLNLTQSTLAMDRATNNSFKSNYF